MGILEWFTKRYDIPEPSTPPGEIRDALNNEVVRSRVETVKQAGAAYELKNTINEALHKMADNTLKQVRKGS